MAQYDYLGVGTVVRTKLNEISCMSRVFDDSNAIVDLDIFNRITTSRWTKDLSTDRDFYQVALTYDRDSNITSALDGVHGDYHGIGDGLGCRLHDGQRQPPDRGEGGDAVRRLDHDHDARRAVDAEPHGQLGPRRSST